MRLLVRPFLSGILLACCWHGAAAGPPLPLPPGLDETAATPQTETKKAGSELETFRQQLDKLQQEVAKAQEKDKGDELLRKQVELQQKQIQVLEKIVRLLADEIKKGPATAVVDKLKDQAAVLESRAEQAARRDLELAGAVDELREQRDAVERNGVLLPATLRELFSSTRTNESPLAIYGTLATSFSAFGDTVSNFPAPTFSPHFYLMLNERFVLEANPEISGQAIELESAQIDWFLTDHLTLVAGRFYSPLGFFNERLHTSWIYRTPDRPLMFNQVYPASLSFNGLMLKGMTYLADWPVKLEAAALVTNGFSQSTATLSARDLADLRAMSDAFNDVNGDKAFGGRVGLVFPEAGIWMGVSGLANGAYDRAGQHDLSLWDVDFSWRQDNWDFRFEFAEVHQQAPVRPLHRKGLYAQIAYRPYHLPNSFVRNLEGVFRFDHVHFDGVSAAVTGLDFGGRERAPVSRNRYTLGLNYYFYESLALRLAYEINDELRVPERNDNGFLALLTWGF